MSVPLQALWPVDQAGRQIPVDPAEDELAALYAYPAERWVRANMVATLDGAAHGPDGVTRSINDPADVRVFVLLRSLADVVLVGAGTVRAEGYSLPRHRPALAARRSAAGMPPTPRLAVVTRSGDVPAHLLEGDRPALVVTCRATGRETLARLAERAGQDAVLVAGDERVDLRRALDALAERGLGRVLCEGGPTLLGQVAAAGALDELCLTLTARLLAGDAPRVLNGGAVDVPVHLAHLLAAGDTLLGRWVRRKPDAAP